MSSITLAAARAVVSYPLPAVFGTMNRRPARGSSEAADPGSALSAVAPQPVTNSAVAATRVAPNLSCLNIVVPFLPCRVCVVESGRRSDYAEAVAPCQLLATVNVLIIVVAAAACWGAPDLSHNEKSAQ